MLIEVIKRVSEKETFPQCIWLNNNGVFRSPYFQQSYAMAQEQ